MKTPTILLLALISIQLSYSQVDDFPVIEVTPDSLSEALLTGGTTDQLLTITNNGDSELIYEISIELLSGEEYQQYALEFDGTDDYVNIPVLAPLQNNPSSQFTFECWVYFNSYTGDVQQILEGHVTGGEFFVETIASSGNDIIFNIPDDQGGYHILQTDDLSLTTWHHIAGTYDGTTQKLYVNGIILDSFNWYNTFTFTTGITLGRDYENDLQHLDGILDEVRIWDVARTEEEIQQNMHWELMGSESGLVAYWNLNEGSGNIAYDNSPNSNNGTLVNQPEWIFSDAPVFHRQWLAVEVDSGQISPGASKFVEVQFDASGLSEGDYYAAISFSSNDPLSPEVIIPAQLSVTPATDIGVSTDTLDFGGIFPGDTLVLPLLITNIGYETLEINNITFTDPEFFCDTTTLVLMPIENYEIAVSFTPTMDGFYESSMTVVSNDPDQPQYLITLLGEGILPPNISVEPDSVSETLYSGKSSTKTLTIINSGNSDLIWETTLENTGYNTITFTKEDWANWSDPENQDCITNNVCITRDSYQGIFNAHTESGYGYGSPDDTEWAFGYTSELQPEDYEVWVDAIYGDPPGMVDQPMSIHLISDDLYFDILFHSWTSGGNGGGFSYTRSSELPMWLELSEYGGIVPAGSSMDIDATFNASWLDGGNYEGSISISSNDPANIQLTIPLHMEVLNAPSIVTSQDTLDFGSLFVGLGDTLSLIVENTGSLDLMIFSAIADLDVYTITPSYAGIDPGETEMFTVTFLADTVADLSGTLTLSCNDPLFPEYAITLLGEGIEPPIISVTPDSMAVEILSGQSITHLFTIINSGGSDLDFEISPNSGNENTSLEFDGTDDFVELSGDINLANSSMTLEAWAKRDAIGTYQMIWGQGITVSNYGLHVGFRPSSEFTFAFLDNDLNTSESYSDFNWHHWACTYDATTQERKIFRDGEEVASDVAWENYQGSGTLFLGSAAWYDDFFNGNIDDVRVWNIVRTQEEIQAYMAVELLGNEPGLIGYWRCNEGMGQTLYDETGSGNEGILVNGVLWSDISAPVSPYWLSSSINEGVVPSSSSLDVLAIFNADNMNEGDYTATISILSNDPLATEVKLPLSMHVTGAPSITTFTDTLDFGYAFINYSDSMLLEVVNDGSDDLIINNTLTDPQEFDVLPPTASIEPGQNFFFTVYFSPLNPEEYSGTLTLINNDSLQNEYVVHLTGEGIEAPVIQVSPESILQSLDQGQTAGQVLQISNEGVTDLQYSITPLSIHALEFDGVDDYCLVPNSTSLDIGTNKLTIELWTKLSELPANISSDLAGIYDSYTDAYIIYEDKLNKELRFKITDDNGTTERPGIAQEDLSLDKWLHIAGVYDGDAEEARIYLNGELKDTHPNDALDDNVRPGQIASFGSEAGQSRFFNGIIDECRIWSVARTQEEINDFMFKELSGSETGLVAYWNFDEGDGHILHDQTENENDGTLYGGTQWKESGAPIYPEWLALTPDAGICVPNSTEDITLLFDATTMEAGNYQSDILVQSNDPATPEITIPAHLEVMEITTTNGLDPFKQFSIYPNPCLGATQLKLVIRERNLVMCEMFDIAGVKVGEFMNEIKSPGAYTIEIDLSDLPAGVYYCVLSTENKSYTTKVIKL